MNTEWNNYNNDSFYESLQPEGLKQFAEKAGLASGCDIQALQPYWEKAESILDACAGYGRAIGALREQGFTGEITAIERNASLFQYLKTHYKDQAELIQCDIHNCTRVKKRFDLILLLWSTLADFSFTEQPFIVQNLAALLNQEGTLIIDAVPLDFKPLLSEQIDERIFRICVNDNIVQIYEPTLKKLHNYVELCGLSSVKTNFYFTEARKKRCLYALQK